MVCMYVHKCTYEIVQKQYIHTQFWVLSIVVMPWAYSSSSVNNLALPYNTGTFRSIKTGRASGGNSVIKDPISG